MASYEVRAERFKMGYDSQIGERTQIADILGNQHHTQPNLLHAACVSKCCRSLLRQTLKIMQMGF